MLCIIFHILFHHGLLQDVQYRRTHVLTSVLKMFDFFSLILPNNWVGKSWHFPCVLVKAWNLSPDSRH